MFERRGPEKGWNSKLREGHTLPGLHRSNTHTYTRGHMRPLLLRQNPPRKRRIRGRGRINFVFSGKNNKPRGTGGGGGLLLVLRPFQPPISPGPLPLLLAPSPSSVLYIHFQLVPSFARNHGTVTSPALGGSARVLELPQVGPASFSVPIATPVSSSSSLLRAGNN